MEFDVKPTKKKELLYLSFGMISYTFDFTEISCKYKIEKICFGVANPQRTAATVMD